MGGIVVAGLVAAAAGCQAAASHPVKPAAFDLGAAARTDDLKTRTAPARVKASPGARPAVVEDVSFQSTEWDPDGTPHTIRIHGYLGRRPPDGAGAGGRRPALILAHGLGGEGDATRAGELAAHLDVVALALSGPGAGQSTGSGVTADDARRLFTAVPDVRGSWLYAYTFSILRAVTWLVNRPDVDPRAVVVAGVSLGGLASLIANGVDARLAGVLVMNASGGLKAAAAAGSWLQTLVNASGGLRLGDRPVTTMMEALDPLAFAGRQHGAVFLIAGAQDEFFPIDQVVRTYRALRAPAVNLVLVPDYDHQWYFGVGCPARCMPGAPARPAGAGACPRDCPRVCPPGMRWPYCGPEASYNRDEEALERWTVLLRALVARVSRAPGGAGPAALPPPPRLERRRDGLVVHAGTPTPRAVRLAVSDNGGYTYAQFLLDADPGAPGVYRFSRPVSEKAIVFAEVVAADGMVATTVPELPEGFRPIIRPFAPVKR
jgi:dienelactone hydrolase